VGKKEIGLLYYCLQVKLLENSKQRLISKKYACFILANQLHIQKTLRYIILKEMENFGLIKTINRQIIEVNELSEDLDDISGISKRVGMF